MDINNMLAPNMLESVGVGGAKAPEIPKIDEVNVPINEPEEEAKNEEKEEVEVKENTELKEEIKEEESEEKKGSPVVEVKVEEEKTEEEEPLEKEDTKKEETVPELKEEEKKEPEEKDELNLKLFKEYMDNEDFIELTIIADNLFVEKKNKIEVKEDSKLPDEIDDFIQGLARKRNYNFEENTVFDFENEDLYINIYNGKNLVFYLRKKNYQDLDFKEYNIDQEKLKRLFSNNLIISGKGTTFKNNFLMGILKLIEKEKKTIVLSKEEMPIEKIPKDTNTIFLNNIDKFESLSEQNPDYVIIKDHNLEELKTYWDILKPYNLIISFNKKLDIFNDPEMNFKEIKINKIFSDEESFKYNIESREDIFLNGNSNNTNTKDLNSSLKLNKQEDDIEILSL